MSKAEIGPLGDSGDSSLEGQAASLSQLLQRLGQSNAYGTLIDPSKLDSIEYPQDLIPDDRYDARGFRVRDFDPLGSKRLLPLGQERLERSLGFGNWRGDKFGEEPFRDPPEGEKGGIEWRSLIPDKETRLDRVPAKDSLRDPLREKDKRVELIISNPLPEEWKQDPYVVTDSAQSELNSDDVRSKYFPMIDGRDERERQRMAEREAEVARTQEEERARHQRLVDELARELAKRDGRRYDFRERFKNLR